jgi:sporulation protein YlmC with PRC-barrel domain
MKNTPTEVLPAGKLIGESVQSSKGEHLGSIEELMIDIENGELAYVVLAPASEHARENRLFAVPWKSLKRSGGVTHFTLDADLQSAPGFDRGKWPSMSDRVWGEEIHGYYGQVPYWQKRYFADDPSGPTQMGGEKKPSPFHS